MNFIIRLIGLIPVSKLTKYLPEIIGFILTKVMKYLSVKKPEKLKLVISYIDKVSRTLNLTLKAGEDGNFDSEEIKAIAEAWKKEL